MRLTLLVTIDTVKPLSLLDILIHSLNLQTSQNFDVVFFNQTLLSESHFRRQLQCAPRFAHSYWTLPRFGLLRRVTLCGTYMRFMPPCSMRDGSATISCRCTWKNFWIADYIAEVSNLLSEHSFDILFGNLRRTVAHG